MWRRLRRETLHALSRYASPLLQGIDGCCRIAKIARYLGEATRNYGNWYKEEAMIYLFAIAFLCVLGLMIADFVDIKTRR